MGTTDLHPLFSLAVVLLSGLVGGELAARLRLPRVTGWILTGLTLRQLSPPGVDLERARSFGVFNDLVLGYIAFTVGSHLVVPRLRNAARRLGSIMLTELLLTPLLVGGALVLLGGLPLRVAGLLAAVAVAQAPGTTLTVVREARARGVFVKTLLGAVVLIDMVAVCLFEVIHDLARGDLVVGHAGDASAVVLEAVRVLAHGAVVGLAVALVTMLLLWRVVGRERLGACLVGAILLAWGAGDAAGASPILAVTFVGIFLANWMTDKEESGERYLGTFEGLLFTLFYTLAGVRLDFAQVLPNLPLVGLFFGARLTGKWLSSQLAMRAAGATRAVRNHLGVALLPHGGVAVGLMVAIQADPRLADVHDQILTIGLSALAVNQILGPSATRWALERTGESGKDRPRLIDFIHEEHIQVDVEAESKEALITELTDLLILTHDLVVNREHLLESILAREREQSTCVGGGLMIPHGVLDGEGEHEMVGVMGLSRAGLDFETPDGRPVHCVVLLATPKGQEERHLAVLAALARSVGSDADVQRQLFRARSAAHAYDVLHAEEAADFNYFLEDAVSRTSRADRRPPQA